MRATRSTACSGSSAARRAIPPQGSFPARPGLQPRPQFGGRFPVALQAKRSHIREVALPSAFRHRQNVVGIPERLSAAFGKTPLFQKPPPRRIVQAPHVPPQSDGVNAAPCANPGIAVEHAFPQVARIRAQPPFMNAGLRTKCAAALRCLPAAPAAQRPARFAALRLLSAKTPAALRTRRMRGLRGFRRQRGFTSPSPNADSSTRLSRLTSAVAAKPD